MKTHLKALLILIVALSIFSLLVFGLYWIVTLNPYYGISLLVGGALIAIYSAIYHYVKND